MSGLRGRNRSTYVRRVEPAPGTKTNILGHTAQRVMRPSGAARCGSGRSNSVPSALAGWARHSSIGAAGMLGSSEAFQDTRNIKNDAFKRRALLELNEHLVMNGCSHVSNNSSNKEVLQVATYFFNKLMPGFSVENINMKPELHFLEAVKSLGYRGVLSKHHMATMSAPSSWPHILAALDFLRLAVAFDNVSHFLRLELQSEADEDFPDEPDYEPVLLHSSNICKAVYSSFMNDESDATLKREAQILVMSRSSGINEEEIVQQKLMEVRQQLAELRSRSDPSVLAQVALREAKSALDASFVLQTTTMEQNVANEQALQSEQGKLDDKQKEITLKQQELERVRLLRDKQTLSQQEIGSMLEKQRTGRSHLKTCEDNLETIAENVGVAELELAKRQNNLVKEFEEVNREMSAAGLVTEKNRDMELRSHFMQEPENLYRTVLPGIRAHRSAISSKIRSYNLEISSVENQKIANPKSRIDRMKVEKKQLGMEEKMEFEKLQKHLSEIEENNSNMAVTRLAATETKIQIKHKSEDIKSQTQKMLSDELNLDEEYTKEKEVERSIPKEHEEEVLRLKDNLDFLLKCDAQFDEELEERHKSQKNCEKLREMGIELSNSPSGEEIEDLLKKTQTENIEAAALLATKRQENVERKKKREYQRRKLDFYEELTGIRWIKPQSNDPDVVACNVWNGENFKVFEGPRKEICEKVFSYLSDKYVPECETVLEKHGLLRKDSTNTNT